MAYLKKPVKRYKYRLFDLLFKTYGADYLNGKKIIVKEIIRMSESTVEHDFGIPLGSRKTIPAPRLALYALHFGVPEKELITPKPIRSKQIKKRA